MKYSAHWLLILLLVLLSILAAGCQRATPAPSPTPIPPPPTALSIPTRPATAWQTTPTATPEVVMEATPGAEEVNPSVSTPEPASSPARDVVGWAYVDVLRTSLFSEPGGKVIAPLSAGERLEIVSISPDKVWLQVHYQHDADAEPLTGWVLTSKSRVFMDLDEIPVAGESSGSADNAGSSDELEAAGEATVLARRLNLRAGPGIDWRIIGALAAGQQVTVLGRSDNAQWLKIQTENGEIGWAAARWLKSDVPIDELPVAGKATTAVPAPVVPKGKIAFQDSPGGNIYIINADGTGLKRIASGFDPAFSPDGKQIAFARWGGDGDTVRVIHVDGSGERVVIGDNKPRSPTWSPDGRYLVYEQVVEDKYCRDTPLGCATDEQIRKEFNGNDCWTYPFGTYCIWDFTIIHFFVTALEMYPVNGGQIRDLPTGSIAHTPRFHPVWPEVLHLTRDGMAIAYIDSNRPPQPIIAYKDFGAPVYSPDGRYIYVSRKDGDSWNIWRYNADGSGPIALTRPPALRDRPINNVTPAVSPDGRFILFLSDRSGDWRLWIMNSDGSNPHLFAAQALADIQFKFDFSRTRMTDWK